jgi:outer membrane lipase/esterase
MNISPMIRLSKAFAALAASAVLLAACGGGNDSPKYSRVVSFGDSLSDVGTYATAGLVATFAGGKYTVNNRVATANNPESKIWVELLADRVGGVRLCAAQTGLESSGPQLGGLAQAVSNNADCFGYAQGGSRVTNPVGPANKALLAVGDASAALGQLTVPLVTQVTNHLNKVVSNSALGTGKAAGAFAADELVTVFAGGNDFFMNFGQFNATVTGGGSAATASTAAVTAMTVAGGELAALVRNNIVNKGANRVVVLTVPDITKTPFGLSIIASAGASGASTAGLMTNMVTAFNNELNTGLAGVPGVLVVNAYATSQAIAANPAAYGLTNVTTPVCSAVAALGSLSCTNATLVSGAVVDTSQYADGVHPTPTGYRLIYQAVIERMTAVGWL